MSEILDDLLVEFPEDDTPSMLPMHTIATAPKFDIAEPVDVGRELSLMKDPEKIFDFSDTSLTPLQQLYIMALVNKGTKASACALAGVSYTKVDKWMKESKEFVEALQNATSVIGDVLEGEAIRRAMNGSDKLLQMLLKANRPEKYADKVTNVKHSGEIVHSWAELAEKADKIERDKLEKEGRILEDTAYSVDEAEEVELDG